MEERRGQCSREAAESCLVEDRVRPEQRGTWIGGGLAVVGLLWLMGAPLGTLLTFGLVLVCPLMHFFMMRVGHHAHGAPAPEDRGITGRDELPTDSSPPPRRDQAQMN